MSFEMPSHEWHCAAPSKSRCAAIAASLWCVTLLLEKVREASSVCAQWKMLTSEVNIS